MPFNLSSKKKKDSTCFHDNLAFEKSNFNINSYKLAKKAEIEKESLSKTNILPKSVVLSWDNVTVRAEQNGFKDELLYVASCGRTSKKYKTILDDVRGVIEPGELLGLIGPSGSGKTTLLNVLNFHKKDNLKVAGNIKVNGKEIDGSQMGLISSYIQQEDLFYGTLTVREHLIFHAMLRMDKGISSKAKLRRVETVLKEFNLEKSADVIIGIPNRIKGISGGEKKRLSFATEMLIDPPLVFCDEPTSGLDSYMAKSIVQYLSRLASTGKTIVCTIHQPSSEAFKMFDKICILSQQKLAFFGAREDALEFFTKSLNRKYPEYTNPADFYIDTLGIDPNEYEYSISNVNKYCDIFSKSKYNDELKEQIENVPSQPFIIPDNFSSYRSTWSTQMRYLLGRSFSNYFKNYHVFLTDLIMSLVTALLGGIIFFETGKMNQDGTCSFDQESVRNLSYVLFYTLFVTSIFSVLSAVLAFPLEIPIYYKEHKASVYRSDTYYLTKILTELPINIMFPALHSVIIYFMVIFGCTYQNILVFICVEILTAIASFSLGHIFSVIANDVNMAISLATPIIAVQLLFSGFFLDKRSNSLAETVNFIRYFSIFNYSFNLLMINQWEHIDHVNCTYTFQALCLNSGKDVLDYQEIKYNELWFNIIMLVALAIGYRAISYLILWAKGSRNDLKDHRAFNGFKRLLCVKN